MSDPDWDDLPPLRDVIAAHDLRADKKFGQNFLLDRNVTDKIARCAGDLAGHSVFEIGPGPGGLTRSLLREGASHVSAIEFDPRAVAALQGLVDFAAGRLTVIEGDALALDLLSLGQPAPRRIVANLPYNIATPLLVGWLRQIRTQPGCYAGMTLMFQKEVAERIVAKPGGKAYGRLAVLVQWLCAAEIVYPLPPQAFTPPPKVSSAVVRFVPKVLPADAPAFEAVEQVTAAAFGQRRKMLRSSLKAYAPYFEACGLDPEQRAETVALDSFIALARAAGCSPGG
ncbi:MAG: 16S rRNA (adenine(1518)-N(6)/adenine(1519)-N(6))-dimethyltransferase RsmA [Rhodospirillales bacterium]|nr:16S rRNA (adenine(1518)-N(6)/adenine(1519)-N(6))-dimethyltransferase RsmA [Rhodospirillales bacterium]MCB9997065.1 16S rRNA (adenine(1518)-N(6)/adenine(1519)-N(6))-dimethyltransferase RsmA [Rhodospirillales bacterium]